MTDKELKKLKMTMVHKPLFVNQAMNAIIPNNLDESDYFYYTIKSNI